jgi:hypothetical protein
MAGDRRAGILATLMLATVACGPRSMTVGGARSGAPGPVVGPTAAAPPSWADTLRQEMLADVLVDFVQGRAVPSNFSSLSQGPELALGSIYVIKARPGKTCASTDPADFEDARLPDFRLRTPACVVKVFPKAQRKEQTVKGGARGGLQLVLGGGRADAEAIYQLTFEDTQAVFESTSECIDVDRLARAQLPARTCAARYVTGAVLTTITWRDYQKADASVRGTYTALVKVGMELYGSTSGMTMTPVLSFDTIDLEAFRLVETDAQGFLRIPATGQKSLALDDLKAELTDAALATLRNRRDDRWSAMFSLDLDSGLDPQRAPPAPIADE